MAQAEAGKGWRTEAALRKRSLEKQKQRKQARCPAFPGKTGPRAPPRPRCLFGQPRGAAQRGGNGDRHGRRLSQTSPEGKGAEQDPATLCLSAPASSTPGLKEPLVPRDTHAKCQSRVRAIRRPMDGCLGTVSPQEGAAGSPRQDKCQRWEGAKLLRSFLGRQRAPLPLTLQLRIAAGSPRPLLPGRKGALAALPWGGGKPTSHPALPG